MYWEHSSVVLEGVNYSNDASIDFHIMLYFFVIFADFGTTPRPLEVLPIVGLQSLWNKFHPTKLSRIQEWCLLIMDKKKSGAHLVLYCMSGAECMEGDSNRKKKGS